MIATRILRVRDENGEHEVPVRVFAPVQTDKAWSCRYEIQWPDRLREGVARGMDSVQVLELVLRMIGAELYTSPYHKAGQLMHESPRGGYGFPVPNDIRDLLEGDDAKFL